MDDFDEWLAVGMSKGFCGPPVCSTHDGTPSTVEEDEEFDDGGDPCIHVLRLYSDDETREAVESNHSPTRWRQLSPTGTGTPVSGGRPGTSGAPVENNGSHPLR